MEMDLSQRTSVTLHDLTKIALGTQTLTGSNTIILHSLLNLVLRKMNCQHEKVTISGFEAMKLETLLKNSTQPVLLFDEFNFDGTFKEIDNLDHLQNCLEEMETKLKEHNEEISLNASESKPYICSLPESSATACGEIFSLMETMERNVCEQLLYGDAGKRMIARIVQPSVKTTKNIQHKVNTLDKELNEATKRITEITNKLNLLDELDRDLQSLENLLAKHHARFLRTLNEIQDILDSKVNRCEWALLIEYLHKKLEAIWRLINIVQYEEKCRRTSSITWDDDKNDNKVGPPTSETTNFSLFDYDKNENKCEPPTNETAHFSLFDYDMTISEHPKLLERIKNIKAEDVKQSIQELTKMRRSAIIYRRFTTLNP